MCMTRASFMGIVGSVCISIRGVSSAAFLLAILKVPSDLVTASPLDYHQTSTLARAIQTCLSEVSPELPLRNTPTVFGN